MSTLVKALQKAGNKHELALKSQPLAPINQLLMLAEKLRNGSTPDRTPAEPGELQKAWPQLQSWLGSAAPPRMLPISVWEQVPELLWWKHKGQPVIAHPRLFAGISWAASQSVPPVRWIEALAASYAEAVDAPLEWRAWLGGFLREWCGRELHPRLDVWRRRDRDYSFWSPTGFPEGMRRKLSNSPGLAVEDALNDAGLDSACSHASELSREAFITCMVYVAEMAQGYDFLHFERVCDWKNLILAGSSTWPSKLAAAVINGLLEPWARFNPPDVTFQKHIQNSLQKWFGPLPGEWTGHWRGATLLSRKILERWKILDVMEQFFEQVGNYAEETRNEMMTRHWKDRSAFWLAYYKRGVVTQARALIGRSMIKKMGEPELRRVFGKAMARLDAKIAMQCGLLLEINGLIVIDHSHSGRGYFYFPANNQKPSTVVAAYHSSEFNNANENDTHQGDWQSRFAELIKEQTGVKVAAREYRPSS
jgi:hypothetical protein